MLKAVNAVSPRGVLVTGNASSASGLTVTMIREPSTDSDFALEAGALVLGDEGTTCIDEFDLSAPFHCQHEHTQQSTIALRPRPSHLCSWLMLLWCTPFCSS